MASHSRSASAMGGHEKTYFEQQREALIGEIAMARFTFWNMEHPGKQTLTSSLWSQFENVMGKDNNGEGETDQADQTEQHDDAGEGDTTVKHEGS
ncbi:DASH complex subunit Dad1-domain-containing protein [Fusarium acuminatum]|uniref:DASH complex subunit Dad1-domain-containing protein n=1 Tax=Fusarium acuminatum TaxID=5515 RepID=A0ABZ2WIS3_9HYPO